MPLTHMQELALYDANGRCRCPLCGKYRKRADFPDQPKATTAQFPGGYAIVHLEPGCRECLEPMREDT